MTEETKHAAKLDKNVAGAAGAPTSTLSKQAGPVVDDRADTKYGPLHPTTSGALDNGSGLEEDAVSDARSEEGRTSGRVGALGAVDAAELVEVVRMPAGEEKSGDTADEADANRFLELAEDGHVQQEEPAANHAQASRPPASDHDKTNELLAGEDEALESTAETEPYANSEDNLGKKLPNDAGNTEVLTAEHVGGFEEGVEDPQNPQAPQDNGQPLGMLGGAKPAENRQGAVPKNELSIELPKDPRYREVLMAEHVEGMGASLDRHDGGVPRQAHDGPVSATEREQDLDREK